VEWSEQRPTRRRVAAIKGGDRNSDVMVMQRVCDGNNLRPDMMCELLLSLKEVGVDDIDDV
jgi:hypothetical protein